MDEGGLGELFDRIFGPRDPGVMDQSSQAPYEGVMEDIKKASQEVFATLGGSYSEHAYENALGVELALMGYPCRHQIPSPIQYKGQVVACGIIDMIVGGIVIEIKAISKLSSKEENQLRNYLTGTGLSQGILINFPPGSEEIEVVEVWI